MNTEHAGAIRGLSIANLVLSILALPGVITGLIFFGIFGSALSGMSAGAIDYYGPSLQNSLTELYYETGIYLTPGDLMQISVAVMTLGGVVLVIGLIMNALALVASILGIRFYNQWEKLGLVMGWSIAGAIVSLLGGDIVTLVLFIIVAAFAYKDKNEAQAYQQPLYAQGYAQPYNQYNQPYTQSYGQPAAQPNPQSYAQSGAQASAQPYAQPGAQVPAEPDQSSAQSPVQSYSQSTDTPTTQAQTDPVAVSESVEPVTIISEEIAEVTEEPPTPMVETPSVETPVGEEPPVEP